MKLNAEELAAKRFPYAIPGVMDDVERRRQKNTYAAAITEVAQPLQDRVEELEEAGNAMRKMLLEVRSEVMDDEDYAYDLSDVIDNWNAILAKQK